MAEVSDAGRPDRSQGLRIRTMLKSGHCHHHRSNRQEQRCRACPSPVGCASRLSTAGRSSHKDKSCAGQKTESSIATNSSLPSRFLPLMSLLEESNTFIQLRDQLLTIFHIYEWLLSFPVFFAKIELCIMSNSIDSENKSYKTKI